MSGGWKDDAEKPRMELLSSKALIEVSKVLTLGAKKYADDNWRKGMNWRRLVGATMRHVAAINDGEDFDAETGLHHAAHALCELMFLLEFQLTGNGTDDRFKQPAFSSAGAPFRNAGDPYPESK